MLVPLGLAVHLIPSVLGRAISKKLGIEIFSKGTQEDLLDLYRGIREQITSLLNGLDPKDLTTMSLGLSHSLSRYAYIPWVYWC